MGVGLGEAQTKPKSATHWSARTMAKGLYQNPPQNAVVFCVNEES